MSDADMEKVTAGLFIILDAPPGYVIAPAVPTFPAHSPGEPPAELDGRFETRTAPMVTWGGDAEPVLGAPSG
jgi:hypothetical protein